MKTKIIIGCFLAVFLLLMTLNINASEIKTETKTTNLKPLVPEFMTTIGKISGYVQDSALSHRPAEKLQFIERIYGYVYTNEETGEGLVYKGFVRPFGEFRLFPRYVTVEPYEDFDGWLFGTINDVEGDLTYIDGYLFYGTFSTSSVFP